MQTRDPVEFTRRQCNHARSSAGEGQVEFVHLSCLARAARWARLGMEHGTVYMQSLADSVKVNKPENEVCHG